MTLEEVPPTIVANQKATSVSARDQGRVAKIRTMILPNDQNIRRRKRGNPECNAPCIFMYNEKVSGCYFVDAMANPFMT